MAKSNYSVLGNLKAQMTAPREDDEQHEIAILPTTPVAPEPIIKALPTPVPPPAPALPPPEIVQRPRSAPEPSRKRRTLIGPTIQINADIPKDLHREIRMLLVTEDRSLADLLESLLREYVLRTKGQ